MLTADYQKFLMLKVRLLSSIKFILHYIIFDYVLKMRSMDSHLEVLKQNKLQKSHKKFAAYT